MSRARSLLTTVTVAFTSACGPLVPVDAADTGDDTGTSGRGDDDDDDGVPEEVGDDGGSPGDGADASDIDDGGDADTGSAGVCGDGVLDPGEACDDANDQPGDGCELDCTATPGLLLWSTMVDGAGGDDAALAVAVTQGSAVLVAGTQELTTSEDVWLATFAADGIPTGDSTFDYGEDEVGTSVVVTPSGVAYVAGLQSSQDRALLLRVDGSALGDVGGAPEDIVPFSAVASPTAEGFVLVTNGGGFGEITATVRRYSSEAAVLADLPQPADVFIGAAARATDGGTILGGGSFGDMGMGSTGWVGALDPGGGPVWSWTSAPEPGVEVRLRGVATAPDGRVVAVGTREIQGPGEDIDFGWIWWWSADGTPEGDGALDIGGATARPTSVVVGNHGIVVGGSTVELDDGFVAGLAMDGSLSWGYELVGDLGLEDGITALAVAPGVGVVAVGWMLQLETGQDAWIGMFSD
jgi:cysteine-rich repeat protein